MSNTISNRSASKKAIASITVSAVLLAIAVVLKLIANLIPFLNFPNGGTVSFVLVPLVLVGLLCGPIWGFVICTTFGVIDMLIGGGFAYHWASIILDYIVAYGLIGAAGFFRKPFFQKKSWAPLAAITLGGLLQFVASFFSGLIVWTQIYDYSDKLAPDFSWGGIVYSASYNGGYMLPNVALCIVVMALILKPLFSMFDLPILRTLNNYKEVKHVELPSFYVLFPIYLVLNIAFLIISANPVLQMNFLVFISLFLSVLIVIVGFILYFKHKDEMKTGQQIVTLLTILISIILIVPSIAIISNLF